MPFIICKLSLMRITVGPTCTCNISTVDSKTSISVRPITQIRWKRFSYIDECKRGIHEDTGILSIAQVSLSLQFTMSITCHCFDSVKNIRGPPLSPSRKQLGNNRRTKRFHLFQVPLHIVIQLQSFVNSSLTRTVTCCSRFDWLLASVLPMHGWN